MGRDEREGREEEGSGDSEQDAVAKWNVIIEIIFRKCNIARDLLQVCYTSSIDHTLTQLERTARAMAIKEERCSVCLKDLPKSSTRRRLNSETFQNPCGDSRRRPYRMQIIFTLFAHQLLVA